MMDVGPILKALCLSVSLLGFVICFIKGFLKRKSVVRFDGSCGFLIYCAVVAAFISDASLQGNMLLSLAAGIFNFQFKGHIDGVYAKTQILIL